MGNNLFSSLVEYNDYVSLYAKQIYSPELWSEQTGCELDEYCDYVQCCESKLYTFGTWYEHTTTLAYPVGEEWDRYADFRPSLLSFHA